MHAKVEVAVEVAWASLNRELVYIIYRKLYIEQYVLCWWWSSVVSSLPHMLNPKIYDAVVDSEHMAPRT